jgi:hypothetical protein
MMSKLGPFKDWGVVNFLQEKLGKAGGDIAKNIGDVVLKGESPAKAVMDVIRGSESNFSAKDVMDAQELLERDLALYEKEIRLQELENERQKEGEAFTERMMKAPESRKYTERLSFFFILGFTALVIATLFMGDRLTAIATNILFFALGVFADGVGAIRQRYFGSSDKDYHVKR